MNLFTTPLGTSAWILSEATMERLGWVLVHSLWQFLLLAILALAVLKLLMRSSASLRYAILVFTMAACVVVPIATWFTLHADTVRIASPVRKDPIEPEPMESRPSPIGTIAETAIASDVPGVAEELAVINKQPLVETFRSSTESNNWWMNARDSLRPWLMTIVTVWILGVMICAVRPLLSWIAIRRWRRVGTSPVNQEATAMLLRLSERLGVRRNVEILRSQLVHVPLVFGYLRPVILLPASLLTNLPTPQLEAIIAHELAHVRRHDFLVNFIQTIIETIFFYHPAIWWLSHRVRIERENCCDDLVVSVLCNRVEYGKALLAVEESPGFAQALAIGARDGSLLTRIQRLAGMEAARRGPIASVAAMITSGLLIAGTAFMIGNLLFAAGNENANQFGKESNGLQIRLIPLSPAVSDESPDLQKLASSFKRPGEMAFAVQLKNVSQKAIAVAGIRYGDSYAPETQGKLNTAMLAPHWFEFEFADMDGKRIMRTPHREFYQQWSTTYNSSVHVLAPGESLIEVLRPAKFMQPMDYDLLPGKYRVQVNYRGPDDSLRENVRKHWPDKPILNAWPHQATSNVTDFSIEEPSNRTKPEDLIWGKPVDGLQAALEVRLPDDAKGNPLAAPGVAIGTSLGITFHLRNVSDKPITFVSETGRQGDHVRVTDEAGKEVEVKSAFFTGWPIDVAWTVMPGEVAQLNLLTPGLGSLDKPGKYKVRYTIRFNSRQQKDESGKIIFPRPGDYDKEVDTGETPLFLREPQKDVSVLKGTENPFVATFRNDIRVEFVGLSRGVGDINAADKWWRPDGSPLDFAPEHRGASGVLPDVLLQDGELDGENRYVRTVIHVHGIGDTSAVTSTATLQNSESFNDNFGGQCAVQHGYIEAPGRTRTFEVGVATDALSPKRWLGRDGKRIESKAEPGSVPAKDMIAEDITIEKVGPESWGKGANSKGGMTDPVGPGDQRMGNLSGTTQVTIRFPIAWRKVDLRLFAIDKSGNSHAADTTIPLDPNDDNADYKRLAKVMPVVYSEVDHFEYQFRVYRHWAIFENVSLWKGTQTEVVMKSETIPTTPMDGAQVSSEKREQIGTVQGKPIYRDEIANGNLVELFTRPIWTKYRTKHREAIDPTEKELQSARIYFLRVHRNRQVQEGGEAKLREQLQAIEAKLSNKELSAAATKKLELERLGLAARLTPPDPSFANFVLDNWKLQKHLYENFGGGRILWQQAGLEAFDATRTWLETQERNGEFQITDPKIREQFYKYWNQDHGAFLTSDKERIRKEFLEPPWVADFPVANEQSQKTSATTYSDIEKTVLDILRKPFIDDPAKGTWQLGAHDIDVHSKLRVIPQRTEVIITLFKVIDRSVPSTLHERRLAMEFLAGADPANLVSRLKKELENAISDPAKPFAAYHEIEILGRMSEHARSCLPLLVKLLDSKDRVAYDAAVNALIIIGARSPDVMNELAKHTDDPVTVYQLGRYGKTAKPLGPLFVKLLDSPSNEIHSYAASALVKTGFDEARGLNVLIADVADGKSEDRSRAATLLAALGSQASSMIPQLRAFENDPDPQVAKAVRDAIARIEKDDRIFTHAEEATKREAAQEASAALNPQREFKLRMLGGDEQTPLAGIEIFATDGYGDSQKKFGPFVTDATGTTQCKLPQGFYTLHLNSKKELPWLHYENYWKDFPPPGMKWLNLRVTGIGVEKWLGGEIHENGVEPAKSAEELARVTYTLLKPIELVLRAVDIDTGRGLPGAYFYLDSAVAEDWAHPIDGANIGASQYRDGVNKFDSNDYKTDADGNFKRFVSDGYLRRPGDSEYGPKYGVWKAPEGYEAVGPGEVAIDFPKTNQSSMEQVFRFRKTK